MRKNLLFTTLVVSLILGTCISAEFNSKKVVYAVDCGSSIQTRSVLGYSLQADTGFSGGKVADYTLNQEAAGATLKYTRDQPIYMTERHDDYTFHYKIPVQTPGKYTLILKFTELYFSNKGQRVFNVMFGEKRVVTNIDIAGSVGKNAAYDVYVEFDYRDGLIFHENTLCTNAIDQSGKLKVVFEKIDIDNPKVDAIVLFKGGLNETDYYEQEALRKEWDRRYEEEKKKKEEERLKKEAARLKKKEKIKIRNDQADDFEEDFEDVQDSESEGGLLSFIISPLGFFLIGVSALGIYVAVSLTSAKAQANKYPVDTILSEKPDESKKAAGSKKDSAQSKDKKKK